MPNTLRGGGKGFKAEVLGLKNLQLSFADLLNGIALDKDLSVGQKTSISRKAAAIVGQGLADSADTIKRRTIANARSTGWPSWLVDAVFKYSDPNGRKKYRLTALAGVRKGARIPKDMTIYREWNPRYRMGPIMKRVGRRKMFSQFKSMGGSKIGMSMAAIYEFGTVGATAYTRKPWPARPAFVPAVNSEKMAALRLVKNAFGGAIETIRSAHASVKPE
jgi:hypothetical protein